MRSTSTLAAIVTSVVLAAQTPISGTACGREHEGVDLVSGGGRLYAPTLSGLVEVSSGPGYCLGCHDGTVATPVLEGPRSATAQEIARHASGHPVAVPYPDDVHGMRRKADLDPRLVLEAGLVTCGTCHGSSNTEKLAIPMQGSSLCLSCHLK